jgi:hypothetical protein
MVLGWEQLHCVALAAFDIWQSGSEMEWAKGTWEKAVSAGIANYSNEIERHRVAILFLGLAGLYHDLCALAWDERAPPTYSYWAEELALEDFVVGQLVGEDPCIEEKDALNHLVNAARPEVVRLLIQLFGDIDSLFVSLWRAGPEGANQKDQDSDDGEKLSDYEILNDATPEKVAAYSWLDSGADVVLDPY